MLIRAENVCAYGASGAWRTERRGAPQPRAVSRAPGVTAPLGVTVTQPCHKLHAAIHCNTFYIRHSYDRLLLNAFMKKLWSNATVTEMDGNVYVCNLKRFLLILSSKNVRIPVVLILTFTWLDVSSEYLYWHSQPRLPLMFTRAGTAFTYPYHESS